MEQTAPPSSSRRARCPVCKSKHKAQYHSLYAAGTSLTVMAEMSRALGENGHGIRRETFGKHLRICLGGRKPDANEAMVQLVADATSDAKTQSEIDFAVAVQRRAQELLQAGEMRVTASHGLQAQALLDRRAEKQADRDFQFNLARLLSGAISLPPLEIIEGRSVDLLAPVSVVEPRA